MKCVALICALLVGSTLAWPGIRHGQRYLEDADMQVDDLPAMWITQKLDHFDANNTATFRLELVGWKRDNPFGRPLGRTIRGIPRVESEPLGATYIPFSLLLSIIYFNKIYLFQVNFIIM